MPDDLVKIPLTLLGSYESPIGFVMIKTSALREIEPYPMMWGISFTADSQTGKVVGFDIFAHQATEDRSIEADSKEVTGRQLNSGEKS